MIPSYGAYTAPRPDPAPKFVTFTARCPACGNDAQWTQGNSLAVTPGIFTIDCSECV